MPVSHTCEWPRPPHRSAPSSCWSLACQSGLRRCRHASTTSAASAMLSCVSSQPPAQSRSMSVVLYEWQASARDNFRLIHGRCSTHSSCGSCTSAPSTTPTVAHAPLVGALWEQGGLTRDCLWEQHVTHTANVHPPPLSLSSLSQKLPSIRQFIGRYLKIKVMKRIATQITPNACHDLAPSGGIAAGQRPFRVRPHADLTEVTPASIKIKAGVFLVWDFGSARVHLIGRCQRKGGRGSMGMAPVCGGFPALLGL